tara:strand:+ start:374 stop:535 length:162 start_codon:yes stop_codon:yes gene_type:complete
MNEVEKNEILEEMVAQAIDEETNNNNLGFLLGAETPLTEEQQKQAMISKKYSN